jgi:DNA-binding CsgD family transcriptional regulator
MNAALSRIYSVLLGVNVRAGMTLPEAGSLASSSVEALARALSKRELSMPDYAYNEARRQRDARVHSLAVAGMPKAQIARQTGLARRTVLNILRRTGFYAVLRHEAEQRGARRVAHAETGTPARAAREHEATADGSE